MYTASLMLSFLSALLIAKVRVSAQSTTGMPSGVRPECGGITPAPDYRAQCTATNSFTLPNGRFVDEYNRFCACKEVVLATQRIFCQGGADFDIYSCNSDGTFNCIYARGFTGWPTCIIDSVLTPPVNDLHCTQGFCEPACMRYSKDLKKFQNLHSCPCAKAQNQQFNSTCANTSNSIPVVRTCQLSANDNFVPQCSADGSWKKLQTGYGAWWCVDSNGNQIGEMSFDAAYPPVC